MRSSDLSKPELYQGEETSSTNDKEYRRKMVGKLTIQTESNEKFASQELSQDYAEGRLPFELLDEIQSFDPTKLHKLDVYYVNRAVDGSKYMPRIHGYIAVGTPGNKHAHTYNFNPDYMGTSFHVSDDILAQINSDDSISSDRKQVINTLKGITFPSVEHFFRTLLFDESKLKGLDITNETRIFRILRKATHPDKSLKGLIFLQDHYHSEPKYLYKVMTANFGSIRIELTSGMKNEDIEAFEKNEAITYTLYPRIETDAVRELANQHRLYTEFMEEKAGIGCAGEIVSKKFVAENTTEAILASMPHFVQKPKSSDPLSANCNKGAMTLLQAAENLSAQKQDRIPKKVKAASVFAVGSSQRMFFWNPLRKNPKETPSKDENQKGLRHQ